MRRPAAVHGTDAGYYRHIKGDWSRPACEPCKLAHADRQRSRSTDGPPPPPRAVPEPPPERRYPCAYCPGMFATRLDGRLHPHSDGGRPCAGSAKYPEPPIRWVPRRGILVAERAS